MAGGRVKSVSEANLLSAEALLRHPAPVPVVEHRRSLHDLRHPQHHPHPYSELGQSAHVLMHHHG